ncbi:uncharacterized protein BT62DRAFT_918456 [Guyanagaster necrorhizus]|uniref:Uncharacterized protein n=1 Tax=Guyanagaster necrorhizus TaxID=856835 RepID=A0A9P7VY40_9AGAR|nr:uncharacterized protein BT62DRAFT_918456 [Guyanagaster necrorhizus MCA 3950]KAG7447956.1 hypothetical protein BT62DRAFT_918456 [Guyanagaster necrorhizus MCA 3950]
MITHRGFSASIVANGKPLPEYLVAVDATNHRVSCWIPSEDGQESVELHWQDHGGKIDTCSFITLDGFTVPGRFLYGCGTAYRSGVRTSKRTERPFIFQQITESEAGRSSSGTSQRDVGMITLRIKRVNRVSSRPPNPHLTLPTSRQGVSQPGDIRVGFGDEVSSFEQHGFTWGVRPFQPESTSRTPSTYVTFVFRYRSRVFLRAQGILPEKEPSPVSTPSPQASSSSQASSSAHAGVPNRRIASAPVTSPGSATSPPAFITPAPSPAIPSGPTSSASSPTVKPSSRRSSSAKARLYNSGNRMPSTDTRRSVSMRPIPYTSTRLPGPGTIGISRTPLQPQNQEGNNNRPDANDD